MSTRVEGWADSGTATSASVPTADGPVAASAGATLPGAVPEAVGPADLPGQPKLLEVDGLDGKFENRGGVYGLRLTEGAAVDSDSSSSDEDEDEEVTDLFADDGEGDTKGSDSESDDESIHDLEDEPDESAAGGSRAEAGSDIDDAEVAAKQHRSPRHSVLNAVDLFEAQHFTKFTGQWENLQTLKVSFEKAGLAKEQQEEFLQCLDEMVYHEGDYIVEQGADGDAMYIITEGEVAVTINIDSSAEAQSSAGGSRKKAGGIIDSGTGAKRRAGKEKVATHLYVGHMFGERSLVRDEPRNANVRVLRGTVHCMRMTKAAFQPFREKDPKFRKMIDKVMEDKERTREMRAKWERRLGQKFSTPEEQREEIKITTLTLKKKTQDGSVMINNYILHDKLGQGSFGTVWQAKNISNSRDYAMKIVDRRSLQRRNRLNRNASTDEVLREVAVMKRLQHRNLVSLYEVIDDPNGKYFYMAQEFMDNGPVMTEQELNIGIPHQTARRYFRQTLLGLAYLHFQGVVHRDIKPSNILMSGHGSEAVCKIADFGTAVIIDRRRAVEDDGGKAWLNDVQGTPAFMPPEVFTAAETGERFCGYAQDMWAMGVLLHCLVVGTPPFMAKNELELEEKLKSEDVRLANDVVIDPHLRVCLLGLLEKDPERRMTLEECIQDNWVTNEMSDPLEFTPPQFLNLYGHYVADIESFQTARKGTSKPGEMKKAAGGGRAAALQARIEAAKANAQGSQPAGAAAGAMGAGRFAGSETGRPSVADRSDRSGSSARSSQAPTPLLASQGSTMSGLMRSGAMLTGRGAEQIERGAASAVATQTLVVRRQPSRGRRSLATTPMGSDDADDIGASKGSSASGRDLMLTSASNMGSANGLEDVSDADLGMAAILNTPIASKFGIRSTAMQGGADNFLKWVPVSTARRGHVPFGGARAAAEEAEATRAQMRRELRQKQIRLLREHMETDGTAHLTEEDMDALFDQRRFAISASRALMEVVDVRVDDHGRIMDDDDEVIARRQARLRKGTQVSALQRGASQSSIRAANRNRDNPSRASSMLQIDGAESVATTPKGSSVGTHRRNDGDTNSTHAMMRTADSPPGLVVAAATTGSLKAAPSFISDGMGGGRSHSPPQDPLADLHFAPETSPAHHRVLDTRSSAVFNGRRPLDRKRAFLSIITKVDGRRSGGAVQTHVMFVARTKDCSLALLSARTFAPPEVQRALIEGEVMMAHDDHDHDDDLDEQMAVGVDETLDGLTPEARRSIVMVGGASAAAAAAATTAASATLPGVASAHSVAVTNEASSAEAGSVTSGPSTATRSFRGMTPAGSRGAVQPPFARSGSSDSSDNSSDDEDFGDVMRLDDDASGGDDDVGGGGGALAKLDNLFADMAKKEEKKKMNDDELWPLQESEHEAMRAKRHQLYSTRDNELVQSVGTTTVNTSVHGAAGASSPAAKGLHKATGMQAAPPATHLGAGENLRLGIRFGAAETPGVRTAMEDRIVALPDVRIEAEATSPAAAAGAGGDEPGSQEGMVEFAWFGVYDGHDGVAASEFLRVHLHQDVLTQASFASVPQNALFSGFRASDSVLQDFLIENDMSGGSTANVVLLRKGPVSDDVTIFCANVGDARAVLSRGGQAVELSHDHKPGVDSERERIEAAGGWVANGRVNKQIAVARSFGDPAYKKLKHSGVWGDREFTADIVIADPEVLKERVEDEDEFVVIACDGVWDVFSSPQAVNFVRRRLIAHGDVSQAARELADKAVSLNSMDNVSVVIVALNQSLLESSGAESSAPSSPSAVGGVSAPTPATVTPVAAEPATSDQVQSGEASSAAVSPQAVQPAAVQATAVQPAAAAARGSAGAAATATIKPTSVDADAGGEAKAATVATPPGTAGPPAAASSDPEPPADPGCACTVM